MTNLEVEIFHITINIIFASQIVSSNDKTPKNE
jgi:hypothetical protein